MNPKPHFYIFCPSAIGLLLVALPLNIATNSHAAAETNLVVAADGSAQFKTVQEAIMAAPAGSAAHPVLIHMSANTESRRTWAHGSAQISNCFAENRGRGTSPVC